MDGLFKIKPSSKTHARYFSPISLPLHLYGREFYILFYTKKQPGYMYIYLETHWLTSQGLELAYF